MSDRGSRFNTFNRTNISRTPSSAIRYPAAIPILMVRGPRSEAGLLCGHLAVSGARKADGYPPM